MDQGLYRKPRGSTGGPGALKEHRCNYKRDRGATGGIWALQEGKRRCRKHIFGYGRDRGATGNLGVATEGIWGATEDPGVAT